MVLSAILLISACGSQESATQKSSSQESVQEGYYLSPLRSVERQVDLGKSDVSLLGELHVETQNNLYTGIGNIPMKLYYNSLNENNSSSSWRHSFSKNMDDFKKRNYSKLAVKSEHFSSKESACSEGFDAIKDLLYKGTLSEYSASFQQQSDTCAIYDANSTLLVELPIYSQSDTALKYHILQREGGDELLFTPDENGTLRALSDRRLHLEQNGTRWIFSDENDVREVYDAKGLLQETLTQGQSLKLSYDEDGHLEKVADNFNNSVAFTYDEKGSLQSLSNSRDAIVTHFDINEGKLKAIHLVKGEENLTVLQANYTQDGLLKTLSYPQSDVNFSYEYNQLKQVVHKKITDLKNSYKRNVAYAYSKNSFSTSDDLNQSLTIDFEMLASTLKATSIKDKNSTLTLEYDKQGLLQKMQNSSFVVKLRHNLQGLITLMQTDANNSVEFSYDGIHNRPTQIIQNGEVQTLAYNLLGQVVASAKEKLDEYLQKRSQNNVQTSYQKYYTYDAKGRVTAITDAEGRIKDFDYSSKRAQTRALITIDKELPSIFNPEYETLISSWNLNYNQAKPHAEKYYTDTTATYLDWTVADRADYHTENLQNKKYIFIGYSYGADSLLEISTRDMSELPNFSAELIITIDPVGWVPTLDPKTKNWINVTAYVNMKELKEGHFEYSGKKWGIPQYKWVVTTKYVPVYGAGDLLAMSGGKSTYAPLVDGLVGKSHEQIDFLANHDEFNCMLAEVSNRHPEIGLFKVTHDDNRDGKFIDKCHIGSSKIYLREK